MSYKLKNFVVFFRDKEILGTKRFIPEEFELGTTLSQPNRSIEMNVNSKAGMKNSGMNRDSNANEFHATA